MQKSYNQRYGTDTFGIQKKKKKNESSFPLTRLRLTSCTILFFERHTIQKYEHDASVGILYS